MVNLDVARLNAIHIDLGLVVSLNSSRTIVTLRGITMETIKHKRADGAASNPRSVCAGQTTLTLRSPPSFASTIGETCPGSLPDY